MRVTSAPARKARKKKIFALTKGYMWGRKNVYKEAVDAMWHAGQNSYRDRRRKKRTFRQLWITRISAVLQSMGKRYSEFAFKLSEKKIIVNRKMLAEMAVKNPSVFKDIVEKVYA